MIFIGMSTITNTDKKSTKVDCELKLDKNQI